jgi:hypothetical protein
VGQQIHRNASALIRQPRKLMSPKIAIEQDAVDKQRDRTFSVLDVA